MDIKTAPFHGPFGDHELTVTVCSYAVNKRLAVNLLHKGFLFFTPILLISGFTVWENTAAKLAESTPRKPGENGKSQHSGIRQLLRARFYHSTKFR